MCASAAPAPSRSEGELLLGRLMCRERSGGEGIEPASTNTLWTCIMGVVRSEGPSETGKAVAVAVVVAVGGSCELRMGRSELWLM